MKRLYFIICALCVTTLAFAQNKKIETFDKNSWRWTEGADKYQSVTIEEGYLVIANLQNIKKASDYQNLAKSFARLPYRPNESFRLTIKYIVPNYNDAVYHILFNTEKKCLMDDEETGEFDSYLLSMDGPEWVLNLDDAGLKNDKLPGKVKQKGEYPMTFVIEKKSKNVSIELNGIQLYEGELPMTNPCIGFMVPLNDKKTSYLKIDEVIIEQADSNDD